ncbi:tryptophan-rich sensory protein [Candidatus Kaiserbacteria bacterium]|nr:tryptophan-rich sensory protein [Candidatus Kaiserbacteria bacterium]
MGVNNSFKLVISMAVSEGAGLLGAMFTSPAIQSGWYATLAKPTLNPPAWVFAPVWVTLYALIAVALWIIWTNTAANRKTKQRAVVLFFAQLGLNALWSVIFFGEHFIGGAFWEILALWVLILMTIIYFAKISRPAAWLLLPYILWVSFAGYLNYSIWMLN